MSFTVLKRSFLSFFLIIFTMFTLSNSAISATAREIDVSVDESLKRFYSLSRTGEELVNKAQGVLVFPRVIKAGFVFGGEYGEGALRLNNKIVDYYNIVAASVGFQIGAEVKTIMLLFMTNEVLKDFRNSQGWKIGADASIALLTIGAGGNIDTTNLRSPIIGIAFGQKGLMGNLTLEGSKITKLNKK
jgi:lipid-binding SYLF domain-containing protein